MVSADCSRKVLLGLFGAYKLYRAVIVAMIAMHMMQVTTDQIVGVIAVG